MLVILFLHLNILTPVSHCKALSQVSFSAFVSRLIKGRFKSIVDASIKLSEAYADLMDNVSNSVDQFKREMDDTDILVYITKAEKCKQVITDSY